MLIGRSDSFCSLTELAGYDRHTVRSRGPNSQVAHPKYGLVGKHDYPRILKLSVRASCLLRIQFSIVCQGRAEEGPNVLVEVPPGELHPSFALSEKGGKIKRKKRKEEEESGLIEKPSPVAATWQLRPSNRVSWRSEARSPRTRRRPVAKAKARLKAKLRDKEGNKEMELVKTQVSPFLRSPSLGCSLQSILSTSKTVLIPHNILDQP